MLFNIPDVFGIYKEMTTIYLMCFILGLVLFICNWYPHQAARLLSSSDHLFEIENDSTFNFSKTKNTRQHLSPYRSKLIAARRAFRCNTCRKQFDDALWEIDHRKPLFLGGSNDDSNLQALCKSCHQIKSSSERRKP